MRLQKLNMALVSITILVASQQIVLADSNPDVKHYGIKQSAPTVGTSLTREIVKVGTIPLNKPYDELTIQQKQTLKDEYENMSPSDEPPFPVKGLYPIYRAIGTAHENLELQYQGSFSAEVLVDSEGNPKSVEILSSPSEEISNAAVAAMMRQKYKPATCSGQPCEMKLPLHAELVGTDEHVANHLSTGDVHLAH